MAEFHHGAEVLFNSTPGGVREIRSAVTFINGCAPIQDVHATAEERAKYINKLILVRNKKDAAQFGTAKDGYSIPADLEAIFAKGDVGTIVVNNVFDPATHLDGDNNPDPSVVTTAEITGAVDIAGNRTGLEKIRECYHHFGFFPKAILCDRSSLPAVRAAMIAHGNKVRALAVVDMPTGLTPQQAVECRGTEGVADFNTDSSRVVICFPHIKVPDSVNGGERLDSLARNYVAALISQDLKYGGPNHSPSNVTIDRATGTEIPIIWEPGDIQSETNLLNAAGICTVRGGYATGINTYGNRSAAFPTSTAQENFIHVQRILDAAHETILFFALEFVDGLAIPENQERFTENVNKWLRTKIGRGEQSWFYDAKFSLPRALNTDEENADGQFKYKLLTKPIGVTERMTVYSEIDLTLAGSVFTAAA
jgi:phage tail sheath protein FI